jgi:hypothetical protein
MSEFPQKIRSVSYDSFLELDPPPSLQDLAQQFSGFGNIPQDRLVLHQAALRQWNLRRIFRRMAEIEREIEREVRASFRPLYPPRILRARF